MCSASEYSLAPKTVLNLLVPSCQPFLQVGFFFVMTLPIDFHTHHAAFGALGSFTLGRFGTPGGFNVHDGRKPGDDEILIGLARPSSGLHLVPFCRHRASDTSNFAENCPLGTSVVVTTIPESDVHRTLSWGTDSWSWPEGRLTLHTPFGKVPDPRVCGWHALRDAVLPGILAILEFDNTSSDEDATAVFALGGTDPGSALLDIPDVVAFARREEDGMATPARNGARPISGFGIDFCLNPDGSPRPPHWLGACSGLTWMVPAGTRLRVPVALGWCHEGVATLGLRTRYAYASLYDGIGDILRSVLERADALEAAAISRDRELRESGLSEERQWLLSHATRGYFGNTQLLRTDSSEPVWSVHEGEYAMMNTLDLSVDQMFFEERFFPWVVREIADLFVARHSYVDRLRVPGETTYHEGGISFTHDMGVRNQFSPPGTSCYELPGLEGCFSHMTQEQLLNWTLLSCTHILMSGDRAWAEKRGDVLASCLDSLERREHPDPAQRRGVPGTDSSRVGSGMEITTYDSLDPALAQARGSLYLTMKLWASYRGLERVFASLGRTASTEHAKTARGRVVRALLDWPTVDGFLPALLNGRNRSAIIPAIEAFVFPLVWADGPVAETPDETALLERLRAHLSRAIDDKICLFDDGGWRISSTSTISWISKGALCQAVAEQVFGRARDTRADRAHIAWQAPGSADWGFTDQIQNGKGMGSRYYPRGVTGILWWPTASQSSRT